MTSRARPESVTRINARLETFLAQKLGAENVEFYEQESCIEDNKNKILFKKFLFRLLIICDDRLYIADNPPKNLDNFIYWDDVIDIKTIDDIPKFLSGMDKENSLHICIKYFNNPKRKKQLEDIKNKIIELKKTIIYSKSIDNKLLEIELNTPRPLSSLNTGRDIEQDLVSIPTFREWANINDTLKLDLGFTNRSDMLLTNRTNKSVRFDDEIKSDSVDDLTDKAVKQRYHGLIDMVNKAKILNPSIGKNTQELNLLSLSLPLTPRSIDGNPLPDYSKLVEFTNISYVSKETSRSLQNLSDRINKDFIKDCEKTETTMDIYVLNPKTKIFQTLKTALFYSKIRGTLNYHNTIDDTNKILERKFEKKSTLEKKFRQLKKEIFLNIDNLIELSNLYDELLKAIFDYTFIKKIFWNSSDLYIFTVKQLNRYLPLSETNMKLGKKSALRRVKELDVSIAFIETLAVVFQETDFFSKRNETLYEEKCRYLHSLIKSLICDPEVCELVDKNFDDQIYDLKNQLKTQVLDLCVVSTVLLWEIVYSISLTSWNSVDFGLESLVKIIETSEYLEIFMSRLIGEISKLLNSNENVLLSPKETVIVFKVLSFLYTLIEKSNTNKIKNILKEKYHEEFKYYFNQDRIRLKSYQYYPIMDDLLSIVKKLSRHVL